MSSVIIQTESELNAYCSSLAGQPWVAVDTEFERVRSYYPRLCLVQIACPEFIACIDPLSIDDLEPLTRALLDSSLLKVMHAARQDLEVLYSVCKRIPNPVFDTQLAAAMAGCGVQVGYAALVSDLAGIDLAKAHTRTDWCKRPLSEAQLQYALDDVRYLGPLYEKLHDTLVRLERRHWLTEECEQLTKVELYSENPELAYRRMVRGYVLPVASQHVLKALTNWREAVAQEVNIPRNWVASDQNLMDIASGAPSSRAELAKINGLRTRFIKNYDAQIIALVKDAVRQAPDEVVWRPPKRLTPEQKLACKRLMAVLRARAFDLGIARSLLGNRKSIERLVRGTKHVPLIEGWRYDAVGVHLLAAMTEIEGACADPDAQVGGYSSSKVSS